MFKSIIRSIQFAIGIVALGQWAMWDNSAYATQFDRGLVPADAKWVIHIDVDALQHSTLAEHFRAGHSKAFEQVRQYVESKLGIDLREEIHGVTMFSDTYDSHTGAVII